MKFGRILCFWLCTSLLAGTAAAQARKPTLQELAAAGGVEIQIIPAFALVKAPPYPDAFDVKLATPNPYPEMRAPDEREEKLRIAIDAEATRLWRAGDFAAVDAMAARFRGSERQTPSGFFKSEIFYEVFRDCHCKHPEEADAWAEMAKAYRAAYPKSPTPILIQATLMMDDAWKQATHGHPDLYMRRLDEAGRLISGNWDIASQDPHVYALIGLLAMSSGVDKPAFLKMSDQIATHAGDYAPAWFAAIDNLSPDWRDDPRLIETLARKAQAGAGADAKTLYARLLYHAWAFTGDDWFFKRAGADRELLRSSTAEFLKRYPDMHNFQMMAQMACSLQDWAMAEPLIARLQVFAPQTYTGFPEYITCRRDIYYRHH